MIRFLLAVTASTVVGLIIATIRVASAEAEFGRPDTIGLVAVTLAIAWLLGLFVYAPASWLLRRRGVSSRVFAALIVGILANAPLFVALLVVDRISGVFAPGEAFLIGVLAAAIGGTHAFIAVRRARPPATVPAAPADAATREETVRTDVD